MNTATLEWAASWIETSLTGETDERVIEFGHNMAMSLRAAGLGQPSTSDVLANPNLGTSARPETKSLSAEAGEVAKGANFTGFVSAAMSPSGALWRTWFDKMGERATLDVINATATLVIEARNLALSASRDVGLSATLASALERTLSHLLASMAGRAHACADEAVAEAETALRQWKEGQQ